MASPRGLAGLLCFALVAAAASAAQYRVGEQRGWSVPAAGAEPLNTWSGRMRFVIGDQLLFVYPKDTDSVLLVDQAAYNACNTTAYVSKFQGGSTVFTLDRSGPFFFISGNEASCKAEQKLIVVVLSVDHTPPGLLPPPPPSMPPSSTPPMPSPMSPPMPSPVSPPSMTPPSAAPMPSPVSPPSMTPPSAAPMPSPMSPPSMTPPAGAPVPSPMSPPSMTPPSGAPMPAPASTPGSAPSPTAPAPGAAPGATPDSPPAPTGPAPSPGTPGSRTNSPPAPGADTTTPGSGAAPVTAGLIGTLAAGIGYAMLAI